MRAVGEAIDTALPPQFLLCAVHDAAAALARVLKVSGALPWYLVAERCIFYLFSAEGPKPALPATVAFTTATSTSVAAAGQDERLGRRRAAHYYPHGQYQQLFKLTFRRPMSS